MNQITYKAPDLAHLMAKLRIKIQPRYRRMRQPDGPEGRLRMMRETVNAVIKYERIELSYGRADEARGYVERLIADAIKHGDSNQEMMDMADYWLREKQLIHKLFKVLVPRFIECPTAYTNLYKAPLKYPQHWKGRSVLELKGNPFPPLVFSGARNKNLIHNVLLDEARKAFHKEQKAKIAEQVNQSEQEQKQKPDNAKTDKETSKAAQEMSENEQLLKSVAANVDGLSEENSNLSDNESSEKDLRQTSSESSSEETTTSENGKEFNPVYIVGL